MPNMPGTRRGWMMAAVLLLAVGRAEAQSVTLAWDPNSEPDLAGYVIGYGTAPGQNQATVDVGMATQWTLSGFTSGGTYYFRVYAYNSLGMRSAPSAEVSTTVGGPSSGGCFGTAPVAGWVCYQGAWIPPDSPLLGGQDEPAPASPTTSSCAGSAPAGGWVCLDGNWLPPDSPLLSAPATQTPTAPAPAPAVPSGPTTCAGTSPGLGWVCVSGNWLPPGHPLITSSQTATAPAPAPTTPTTCVTPSPGLSWVCLNGNWLPPDHPLLKGGY